MARNPIPERNPVHDLFAGSLLRVDSAYLLTVTPHSGAILIAQGSFVVRYAIPFLGKPHLSIVPGLVALDYGEILAGEDAWEFLLKRSNLHPRADVIGYRNDGQDEMIVVKKLDLAQPVDVLVYIDERATLPLASVKALIAPENAAIPARLLEYLPRYNSLAEWQDQYARH
jgi:hypothetical protein